jgi:hypothetical protein
LCGGFLYCFPKKYAGGIVPKPPKPGFVSFGAIDAGY